MKVAAHIVTTTYRQVHHVDRLGTEKVKECCLQLDSHKQVEISINMETGNGYWGDS